MLSIAKPSINENFTDPKPSDATLWPQSQRNATFSLVRRKKFSLGPALILLRTSRKIFTLLVLAHVTIHITCVSQRICSQREVATPTPSDVHSAARSPVPVQGFVDEGKNKKQTTQC